MENPWRNLPSEPPYVLPDDREAIDWFNQTAKPEHFIHLEHLPEPFLGRPDAPAVLLGLNPGYKPEDDRWHSDPPFVARSRANLTHERADYPFYLLDPSLQSPGHHWWSRKFRSPIAASSLEAVASSVLCIELFPYHSKRFAHSEVRVPSQSYSWHLVERAMDRGAIIVLLRSERLWMRVLPALSSYARLHRVRNVQNPSISPRNLPTAFDELVQEIGSWTVGGTQDVPASATRLHGYAVHSRSGPKWPLTAVDFSTSDQDSPMPQNTFRILSELESLGFTDADLRIIHHKADVTIRGHLAYCEKTSEFRGVTNMRVQDRLRHVLKAFRDANLPSPAASGVFRRLAEDARRSIP
jgi:hypothetical protein